MDGAIADGEGPAFPLVCTSSKDVIGNLTKSLKSYLKDGGTRRKVVSATSQELSPKRRQNLVKKAKELGFELVQLYDRAALADRLQSDPKWCLELLNLTGEAQVLSVEPLSSRPLTQQELIGRDADRSWLRETSGDRLLMGHPGSGKTSLLYSLAREGWGLFLVGEDLAKVAPEIRSKRPNVVIVDDAHVGPDRLVRLVQLRRELSAGFSIVASVWPGARDAVTERLGLPPAQVRELELLTRDQIVQVVRSCGLAGPTELIREIVDQAGGRPGLAVTLVHLCRREGVREVALGTALKRSVHTSLQGLVGKDAVQILAAFAIGGVHGVSWSGVARAFSLPILDLQQTLAELEASGVLENVHEGHLAVQPATLRHALVRDLFFSGSAPLDYRPLVEASRSVRGVAETLVGARALGGQVSLAVLWDVLERVGSESAWVNFASLGRDEATRVLNEKPELLSQVAAVALPRAPETAIGKLLDRSAANSRHLASFPKAPLHQVSDWIAEARPGTGEGLERRETLLRSAARWMALGGDEAIGMSAFVIAFSPQCCWTDCDPGSGRTFTYCTSYLTPRELQGVGDLWETWLPTFQPSAERGWRPMMNLLRAWVYPDPKLVEVSRRDDEVRDALRQVACRMLQDVTSLFGERPGIQQKLASYAERVQVALPLRLDPDYEFLFPGLDALGVDWQKGEARLLEAANRLAEAWSAREPIWVARRIAELAREALSVQSTYPDYSGTVCRLIAETTDRPIEWIRAMEDAGVFGGHVEPFVRRMIALQDSGWTAVAREFLERPEWAGVIIELVLTSPAPPTDLLEASLVRLSRRNEDHVKILAARGAVPDETLRRLLKHENPNIASAAAVGEWLSAPKGTVRESLLGDWREAVLADSSGQRDEFWLIEILRADRELARRWLDLHLSPDRPYTAYPDRVISVAVSSLDPSERGELLSLLPEQHQHGWLISLLIGDDLGTYRGFLAEPRWAQSHLDPLARSPASSPLEEEPELRQAWIGKAQLALQAGYSPEDVARARLDSPKGWSGKESVMWESWIDRFRPLGQHEDPLVRGMASEAIRIATGRRDDARRAEKREAIFGR